MPDLRQRLEHSLRGRVCFLGVGNLAYGDDGFGVRLAEKLVAEGVPEVIIAGTTPDRWIGQAADFDHIVFLDVVEFGGEPGSVIFLDSAQIASRFPQISTHKISLGLLAQWAESNGTTKAWLLGVQPESLESTPQLTPQLKKSLQLLLDLLTGHVGTAARGCPAEPKPGSELEVNA